MSKKENPQIELIAAALDSGVQLYKAFQYGEEIIKEVRGLVALRDNLDNEVSKKKAQADKAIAAIEVEILSAQEALEKIKSSAKSAAQKAEEQAKQRALKEQSDHESVMEQYRLQIEAAQDTLDNLNAGIEKARSDFATVSEQVAEIDKKRAKLLASLGG